MSKPAVDFLYLNETDMITAGVTDMALCMSTMEEMLATFRDGDFLMGGPDANSHGMLLNFPDQSPFPNMPLSGPDRRFMAMPAYLGGPFDRVGLKWYGSNPDNRHQGLPRSIHLYVLSDKISGAPLALMSGNLLSAYRTGAMPGLGVKYLAREDARVLAVVGPGVMNTTALEAILIARPALTTVLVAGRNATSTAAFIEQVKSTHPQLERVESVESIQAAVECADIVSVATSSPAGVENYPYIASEWIRPGALLLLAATIKLDEKFILDRARNVADSARLYEAYAAEYGAPAHDMIGILGVYWNDLIAEGKMERSSIDDLAAIISGDVVGRRSDEEIILLGLGGMPVQDVAWASVVYESAKSQGVGSSLSLWDSPALA